MIMQILLLVLVTVYIMSTNSFSGLWVGLELFSFFLMPWFMDGESKFSKIYIFFYYLTQFTASISLLVSSLTFFNKLCSIVLFSSLQLKMSCFPFHSWFVATLPHVSLKKVMVLSSLSKIAPLAMLTLLVPPSGFIWVLVMGLVLSLGGFSTPCLRSIAAYSSVVHSSWFVICACVSKTLSVFYILSYFMMSMPLHFLFSMESQTSMKSVLAMKKEQSCLTMLILSLSGLPPFLGFIPKLLVIQTLISGGVMMEAVILGVLSVLPVYFYFKVGALGLGMKSFIWSLCSPIPLMP